MTELVSFEIQISFATKRVGEKTSDELTVSNPASVLELSATHRIILCNASPREMIGVIAVRSDIFVSISTVSH